MTVTIADVLHHAADNVLWTGGESEYTYFKIRGNNIRRFSCDAVRRAVEQLDYQGDYWKIAEGLTRMGVDTYACDAFRRFDYGQEFSVEEQAARYTWLKFAALIAEEQGV